MGSLYALLLYWIPWSILFYYSFRLNRALADRGQFPVEMGLRRIMPREAAIHTDELCLRGKTLYGWTRPFWTVAFAELWCSWIVLAWGTQLVVLHTSPSMEPVTRALYEMGHFPAINIGITLVIIGIMQQVALFFWHRILRLVCLLAATSFFIFVTIAFWRSVPYLPGAYIVPTYVAAMTIRFIQIAGRKE